MIRLNREEWRRRLLAGIVADFRELQRLRLLAAAPLVSGASQAEEELARIGPLLAGDLAMDAAGIDPDWEITEARWRAVRRMSERLSLLRVLMSLLSLLHRMALSRPNVTAEASAQALAIFRLRQAPDIAATAPLNRGLVSSLAVAPHAPDPGYSALGFEGATAV